MREFQERRKIRKIFFSIPVIAILLIIAIFLLFSNIKVYKKSKEAIFLSSIVEQELAELEKRKLELESNIAVLQTESGIEEEIRKKFNVQKPGEEVLVIVDKAEDNAQINSKKGKITGFFSKIWKAIKSIF